MNEQVHWTVALPWITFFIGLALFGILGWKSKKNYERTKAEQEKLERERKQTAKDLERQYAITQSVLGEQERSRGAFVKGAFGQGAFGKLAGTAAESEVEQKQQKSQYLH